MLKLNSHVNNRKLSSLSVCVFHSACHFYDSAAFSKTSFCPVQSTSVGKYNYIRTCPLSHLSELTMLGPTPNSKHGHILLQSYLLHPTNAQSKADIDFGVLKTNIPLQFNKYSLNSFNIFLIHPPLSLGCHIFQYLWHCHCIMCTYCMCTLSFYALFIWLYVLLHVICN